MSAALLEQIIQWLLTGALTFKDNDAFAQQFGAILQACKDENRDPTADEWAIIRGFGTDQHDALANA